jgi:glycosyltransferase involved in cell wall biosynthesis
MNIFVVVPAFNEEKRIGAVLSQLAKTRFPVVVVDDGSTDDTPRVLSQYTTHRPPLTVLTHRVNLGKGAAMKTGAEYAFSQGAEAVIFMDSDGQHKVEDLPKFLEALKTGKYDIVFGSRNLGMGVPFERYVGNKLASILVNQLFGIYVSDLVCGFRAITESAFKKLDWESAGYGVETEMVVRCGTLKLKHCEVSVATLYYDKFKGVSVLDAIGILFAVFRWRLRR